MAGFSRGIFWEVPKRAIFDFVADSAFRYSAALSFYTMLSLAPLLIMVLSLTTLFVETQDVKRELLTQIEELVGRQGAETIEVVLKNAEASGQSRSATIFGVVLLFFGASAVFAQLQDALNEIWGVRPDPGKVWWSFIITRLISFGMVLAVGFLLLVSLIFSAVITTLSTRLSVDMPGGARLWEWIDVSTSLIVFTILFAMIFRFLPDVRIVWSDVWVGAAITAILFTAGKAGIGAYLGHSSIGSVYGAAGSLVVLLFWIYYSSLTVFLGAELAQAYTRRFGSAIQPRRFGVLVKK